MDIELEENMDDVLRLKSELILSFCEIVMDGKRNIPAEANSVIDRCLPIIYEKYIKDPKPENMPTLGDLYECLKRQPEPQVRRIVTALELYVTGSLNYFNHHTSVQLNNRLVCFDIKKLGNKLKPLAMLILQNFVWNRISANRDKGRHRAITSTNFIFCSKNRRRQGIFHRHPGSVAANGAAWQPASRKTSRIC